MNVQPVQSAVGAPTDQTRGASKGAATTPTCAYAVSPTQGDLLVVAFMVAPDSVTVNGVKDTLGNTWGLAGSRDVSTTTVPFKIMIYSAMEEAGSAADTITVTLGAAPTDTYMTCFEVAGATAAVALTQSGSGTATSGSSYSMSVSSLSPYASDLVYAFSGYEACGASGSPTYDAAFTAMSARGAADFQGPGSGATCGAASAKYTINTQDEYKVPTSTTSLTAAMGISFSAISRSTWGWAEVAVDFELQVSQPVSLTVAESGAPTATFALGGCSPVPLKITGDGATHTILAARSCSLSVNVPSDGGNARYRFANSALSDSLLTCSGGPSPLAPCFVGVFTYYYELQNTYRASTNGNGPPTWDSGITITTSGTLDGVSSTTICAIAPTAGTTVAASCAGYADYGKTVTYPSLAAGSAFNIQWKAYGTSAFADTSAGNTHTVTYYKQLNNTYAVTARAQALFDPGMTWAVTGTLGGATGSTVCSITSTAVSSDTCAGWADYHLAVSISQAASSPPANSRWMSATICSFSDVTGGNTRSCDSFKQWSNGFLYSVSGGGAPAAPSLTCNDFGSPALFVLSTSAQSFWCDNGAPASSTDPTGGSSATERWSDNGQTNSVTSGGGTDAFAYYHQYLVTYAYSVTHGGAPSVSGIVGYTYFGGSQQLTPTSGGSSAWTDAGSTSTYATPIAGGTGEQWEAATSTFQIVASATLNPVYSHQYFLTVVSPHDTPTGQGWYDAGSSAGFAVTNPTVGGAPGVRYVFASWNSTDSGGYTGTQASATALMSGPVTETAAWEVQYYVTYAQTGCVLSVPLPAGEWVASGDAATGTFQFTVSGSGTRCLFVSDDRPALIDAPTTVTGAYQTQYFLTVASPHDSPSGQGWYDSGSIAAASVTSPTDELSGTRYVVTGFTGTGDAPASGSGSSVAFIIGSPSSVTWDWSPQYYLTVSSPYGSPTGTGWYDSGAVAPFGVTTPAYDGPGTRYVFSSWSSSDAGGYNGASNPGSVTMGNPITETASWGPQYLVSYLSSGCAISVASPSSEWVEDGGSASGVFPLSVTNGAGTRCNFLSDDRPATVTGPTNVTGSYQTQYYLAVTSAYGTVSGAGWYDSGAAATFGVTPTIEPRDATSRFVLVGWDTGDNGTVLMNAPVSETAEWGIQYLVNFLQQGSLVEPSFNYSAGLGESGSGLTPSSAWVSSGNELEFAFQASVSGGPGTRYHLTGTNDASPVGVVGPLNVTAYYETQYLVHYTAAGCALPVAPPADEWVDSGGHATGAFDSSVSAAQTRCFFTGDDRPSPVAAPATVTGSYQTQYYLGVISAHDTPTGEGWYNASAVVAFGVSSPADTGPGTRYVFSSWSSSDAGGYSGTSLSASVTVSNPVNETASWMTQYYLNVTSAHGVTTGSGWYDTGVTAYFGVSPTTVPVSPGVRYAFQGWLPGGMGNVTMLGPVDEAAQWVTQDHVQYSQSGCSLAVSVPPEWVDSGGPATESFPSLVSGPGTQCLFVSDDRPPAVVMPLTVNGTYGTQFMLTLSTDHGATLGDGWYDRDANASFIVGPTVADGYAFTGWDGSPGGYTGPNAAASVTMSSPISETAQWILIATTTSSTTTYTTTFISTETSTTTTMSTTVTVTTGSSSTSTTITAPTTSTTTSTITTTPSSTTTATVTTSTTATVTTTITLTPSGTSVQCLPSAVVVGNHVSCRAVVTGSSPGGVVAWSSSAAGKFSRLTCRLSNHTCTVLFTPTVAGASVTIAGSYSGDSRNSQSAGTFRLTVNTRATLTAVSCRPASTVAGSSRLIICTAVVKGYFPAGTVNWSQVGGSGTVSFTAPSCALSGGRCSVTMHGVKAGSITLLAHYGSDGNNDGSSRNAIVTVLPTKTGLVVSCDSAVVPVGSDATCTARLTGYAGSVAGEELVWTQIKGPGRVSFSSAVCIIGPDGTCSVTVRGTAAGSLQFKVFYGGDQNDLRSAKAHSLRVTRS